MAVAHDALMARLGFQIGMLCQKIGDLRFNSLGQQRTRAAAQDLCERIGEHPWLGELDDVTLRHGVSLLHWRSGGVEHHHDTPPDLVKPSPTSGHSSAALDLTDSDTSHRRAAAGLVPARPVKELGVELLCPVRRTAGTRKASYITIGLG
jgi:hypothetical protein